MSNEAINMEMPLLRDDMPNASAAACGLKIDFGRQRMTASDFNALVDFGRERRILEEHRRMAAGEIVNLTEKRAALHMSLRSFSAKSPFYEDVAAERARLFDFAERVRNGRWRGCRGDRITDVINVGIGGSDMGPRAIWHAARPPRPSIHLHFLSSVDGVLLERILADCRPQSTLIIISSKSFTTREMQVNAAAVDQWLLDHGIVGTDRERHMVVVSANPHAAEIMCLPEQNFFHIWDWVGGRFSVWGAIGLPIIIALGTEVFRELLQGAWEMDRHSLAAPIEENLPAILALLEYWNSTRLDMASHSLLPYDERFRVMVPWLQQLEMESLGKRRRPDGSVVEGATGLAVWGANGNEAQHSFYQWLREGTGRTSIDLVWSRLPGHRYAEHFRVLLANARAQAEVLVRRELDGPYFNAVNTIELDAASPRRVGAMMAMYEHKTTMLGTLFGINPFDQPGVELGKKLSRRAEAGADLSAILD